MKETNFETEVEAMVISCLRDVDVMETCGWMQEQYNAALQLLDKLCFVARMENETTYVNNMIWLYFLMGWICGDQ